MNYVLDTNAVIYAQKGVLTEGLPLGRHFVSVITEIELLSFAHLTTQQEQALLDLLGDVTVITIDHEVKRGAIDLRRRHRLRIPDAIIAATAIMLDAQLLTNDAKLAALPGLRCRSLHLSST